tara:strand:+ start:152 stop:292 length:141 start_codon:yes stop_codon:yes gene_type:complete
MFKYDRNDWSQRGIDIEGLAALSGDGYSTSLSNDGTAFFTGVPWCS